MRLLSAWVLPITIHNNRYAPAAAFQPIPGEREQLRPVSLYIPDAIGRKPIHPDILAGPRDELGYGSTIGIILHDKDYFPRAGSVVHLGTPPI